MFLICQLFLFIHQKILLQNKREVELDDTIFSIDQLKQKNFFTSKSSWFTKNEYINLNLSESEFKILKKLCLQDYQTETDIVKIADVILNYCTKSCIINFINNLIKMLKENKQNQSFLLLDSLNKTLYLQEFVFMYWESLSLSDNDLCLETFLDSTADVISINNLNYSSMVEDTKYLTLKLNSETLEEIDKNEFLRRALVLLEVSALHVYRVMPQKEFFNKKVCSLKTRNFKEVDKLLGEKKKQIVNLSIEIDDEKDLLLLKNYPNLKSLSISSNLISPKEIKFDLPQGLTLLELKSTATSFFKKELLVKLKDLKTLIFIPKRPYERTKELLDSVKSSKISSFFYSAGKNLEKEDLLLLQKINLNNLQVGDLETGLSLNNNINVLGLRIEEMDDSKINFIKDLTNLKDLTLVYKSSPFKQERKNMNFEVLKNTKLNSLSLYLSPFYNYNFSFLENLKVTKLRIVCLNLNLSSMHSNKHLIKLTDSNNRKLLENAKQLTFHRVFLEIPDFNYEINCEEFEMINSEYTNLNLLFKSFNKIKKVKLFFLSLRSNDLKDLIGKNSLEELILHDAFADEKECKMFIYQRFTNENIKYIKINQYGTKFSVEDLEAFGNKFVNAKIKLNDMGLTVNRIVVREKEEKKDDFYEYL